MNKLFILVLILASVQVFGQIENFDALVEECLEIKHPACAGKCKVSLSRTCCKTIVHNTGKSGLNNDIPDIGDPGYATIELVELHGRDYLRENGYPFLKNDNGHEIKPEPSLIVLEEGYCSVDKFGRGVWEPTDIAAKCKAKLAEIAKADSTIIPPCKEPIKISGWNEDGIYVSWCDYQNFLSFDPELIDLLVKEYSKNRILKPIEKTICLGDSLLFNGRFRRETGGYIKETSDTMYYLNLDVIKPVETFEAKMGDSDTTIETTHTSELTGCDSIHTLVIMKKLKQKTFVDPCNEAFIAWAKRKGIFVETFVSTGHSAFYGDDAEVSPFKPRIGVQFGYQWRHLQQKGFINVGCIEESTSVGLGVNTLGETFYQNLFCENCEGNLTNRNPYVMRAFVRREIHIISLFKPKMPKVLKNIDISIGGEYALSYAPSDLVDIQTQEKKFHDFGHELSAPLRIEKGFNIGSFQFGVFVGSKLTVNSFLKFYGNASTGITAKF